MILLMAAGFKWVKDQARRLSVVLRLIDVGLSLDWVIPIRFDYTMKRS